MGRAKGTRTIDKARSGQGATARTGRPDRERRTARARARQRGRVRRRVLLACVAAVAVAATVIAVDRTGDDYPIGTVRVVAVTKRNHVVGGRVRYPITPPVGGEHDEVWQNCGAYDEPVGDVHAVHSLEHGAVWITYRPGLAADQVAVLDALARSQSHILVSPYPNLPAPVVASAWGRQLRLDRATDPRLASFVRDFRLSSHVPEPGGSCTGGTGAPS